MKLKVYGKPTITANGNVFESINGHYSPRTGITTVDINCDIVTLCTVTEVLNRELNEFLAQLNDETTAKLKRLVQEALDNAED